jgi:hypothetical protein
MIIIPAGLIGPSLIMRTISSFCCARRLSSSKRHSGQVLASSIVHAAIGHQRGTAASGSRQSSADSRPAYAQGFPALTSIQALASASVAAIMSAVAPDWKVFPVCPR